MANNTLRGFRWAYAKNGASKPPVRNIHVTTGYATKLVRGDALKFAADGVVQAAAGDALICGVMHGVRLYFDGTIRKRGRYLPASTSYGTDLSKQSIVEMIPVAGQVFEVDANAATATTEAGWKAFINENCNHVIESGTLNISYMALDTSTHAITAAQWRIVGIAGYVNHDFASSRVKLLVECNQSEEPTYSTTQTA